jgi:hypothetical protein
MVAHGGVVAPHLRHGVSDSSCRDALDFERLVSGVEKSVSINDAVTTGI